MGTLEIWVWNVNHGNSIYMRTPNDKDIFIDCGSDDTSKFSPAQYVREKFGRTTDYLIITHPHYDHISDISNFIKYQRRDTTVLERPKLPLEKILQENQGWAKDIVKEYYNFEQEFNHPVSDDKNPTYETWGGGVSFISYIPVLPDSKLNDNSVCTFIKYGNFKLLCPGDLGEPGWTKLLSDKDFQAHLKTTNFLIASHHGRNEGYYQPVFDYLQPKLVIVSDGKYRDTSVTDKYNKIIDKEWDVYNNSTKELEKRKLISTRNDGHISITITDGTSVSVKINNNIE